ncbi:unnamed protein product [Brassica oleracea]
MTQASDSSPTVVISETTTQLGGLAEIEFQITIPATENPTPFVTSETSNSSHSLEQLHLASTISDSNNLKIIISKHNSPLITNRASQNHALAVSTKSTHPLAECVAPPTCSPIPITLQPPVITSPILPTPSSSATQNLAEKLRVKVEVQVDYMWLPPTCLHCHELGNVIKNCLKFTPPKDPSPPAPTASVPGTKGKQKGSESQEKNSCKSCTEQTLCTS